MNYLDFVLRIGSDSTITSTFQDNVVVSKLELSNDIKDFKDKLATPGKKFEKQQVIDFGENLRKALFKDKIEEQFKEAMNIVADGHEFGIRILLDVDPTFADYPWETMSNNRICLATDIRTPIVRIFPGNNKAVNLKDKLPKILFILSNVIGEYYVDTVKEMEIINDALPDSQHIAEPEKVEIATRARIGKAINSDTFNIIHFVGHGNFEDDAGYLALRDEDGRLDKANEDVITALFRNTNSLGLVILNACSTAQISSNFTGLVPKLLSTIPAVIAMRQPISNSAAKSFVDGFYSNLLSDSIEETIQKARNSMYINNDCNGIDFSIPVLYLGWRGEKTTKKIFVKSYVDMDEIRTKISSVQKKPSEILQSIFALNKNYFDFEKMVTSILEQNQDGIDLLSRNPFFWDPALKDFRNKCELTIADICLVFSTSSDTLADKSQSLIHKLDDLSRSIRNGIREKIEESWKELVKEYDLVLVLCSRTVAGELGDN